MCLTCPSDERYRTNARRCDAIRDLPPGRMDVAGRHLCPHGDNTSPLPPACALVLAARRAPDSSLNRVLDVVLSCAGSNILRAVYVVVDGASPWPELDERRDVIVIHAPVASPAVSLNVRIGLERIVASLPRGPAAVVLIDGTEPPPERDAIVEVVRRWRVGGAAAVRSSSSASPAAKEGRPILLDRSLWPRAMHLTSKHDLDTLLRSVAVETVDLSSKDPA